MGTRNKFIRANGFAVASDADATPTVNLTATSSKVTGNLTIVDTSNNTIAVLGGSSTEYVINEAGADLDFRIETDTNANFLTINSGVNSGVGSMGIGQAAVADQMLSIDHPATTATAATDYFTVNVDGGAAVTVPSGTTALVASVNVNEPNITATGTVTNAATVNIVDAPTEGGTGNYAFRVQAGDVRFNDDSGSWDFVVETNSIANGFVVDGGTDSFAFGAAGDVDRFIHVARQARTATAATNYADIFVEPDGAVTIPAGTTSIVAAVHIVEPNITATGTVTEACTLYVSGAPTEGTDNFAILVDGGDVNLAGGAILAQAATTGFTFIPRLDTGAPSGTPAGIQAGNVAMCYDVTNNALEVYNGSGWRTIATV